VRIHGASIGEKGKSSATGGEFGRRLESGRLGKSWVVERKRGSFGRESSGLLSTSQQKYDPSTSG